MAAAAETREIEVAGRTLAVSSPGKVFFPALGLTKWDLVQYYASVGPGVLRGVHLRPMALKRFPNGIDHDFFFQKRIAAGAPEWLHTVTTSTSNGTESRELCPADLAHVLWAINMGCVDLNPWPARGDDLDHPDELRIDLDPQPGVPFSTVRAVAAVVHAYLTELGMTGWPKTSGSRGIHIYVRIARRWGSIEVRNAAVALAREIERRAPTIATASWWKEQRGDRVFIDFNQNARDRTIASAYSVRPVPDARVSAPFHWHELDAIELADFTMATMPARFAAIGDASEGIDDVAHDLTPLLEQFAADSAAGIPDAPWPPQFRKMPGEASRVQPSKARDPNKPARPKRASKAEIHATSAPSGTPGGEAGTATHD